TISPIRKTQLVNITFESTDKTLAMKAANALADAYIDSHLDAKLQMTRKATAWLTGRMENLKEKLNSAEKNLQDFRDRENLVDMQGLRSLAAKELQEISSNLVIAQEKRAKAENNYKQVKALAGKSPEAFESIPAVLKHNLIQNFKSAKAKAEHTISIYAKRYGPQHPKMIAAKSQLETATRNIEKQIGLVVAGIEKEFEIAKENEKTLRRALEKSRKRIQEINRKDFELNELQQEVETNRKLYNTFFTRFQETSATEDLKSVNARIMDPAVLPRMPAKPRKLMALAIAAFAGLIIGIFFTLLREGMDKALRNADDVEAKLGFPVLGLVPFKNLKRKQGLNPLSIFANPEFSEFAESIRTIRTSVILSGLDDTNKTTLVTSSVPNEGKTTIASSLAMALGQIEKVLLIDADMRRPSIGKLFDLENNAPGLSNYIARTESVGECVHQYRNSNLYVMPAGVSPANPLELLSSNRFTTALNDLGMLYDRIVIDTGPINLVSDPMVLSPHAQTLIYVVKAGETPDALVRSGLKRLSGVKQNIAGVVLNHYIVEKGEDVGKYGYAYKEEVPQQEDGEQASFDLIVPDFKVKR
ncbi:MAG: polysaccharide biosynthesis tyrosine autokinase, partial [Gammaproteobacteria bacterium]|nr:polysaccharide biosynthesis tyrosine autokinase [Gammaproteobacteria bacterium]